MAIIFVSVKPIILKERSSSNNKWFKLSKLAETLRMLQWRKEKAFISNTIGNFLVIEKFRRGVIGLIVEVYIVNNYNRKNPKNNKITLMQPNLFVIVNFKRKGVSSNHGCNKINYSEPMQITLRITNTLACIYISHLGTVLKFDPKQTRALTWCFFNCPSVPTR